MRSPLRRSDVTRVMNQAGLHCPRCDRILRIYIFLRNDQSFNYWPWIDVALSFM